jgi:HEPN domain-containing protein
MTEPSQPWFDSARRSLDAAEVLHAAGRWDQACFHAQQAVELALKAVIAQQNVAPPHLHSITDLLARQPPPVQQSLLHLAGEFRRLNSYYMATRYPDAIVGDLPGEQAADRALAAAREGVAIIERLMLSTNP